MQVGESDVWFGSIAAGSIQAVQPGSGTVWEISGIWHGTMISMGKTDGTNGTIWGASIADIGIQEQTKYLTSNSNYLVIKNPTGNGAFYSYDYLRVV